METGCVTLGDRSAYDLCVVEWEDGARTYRAHVSWDGSVLRTSYDVSIDWRWLEGQNRMGRVEWSSPEVESWFYSELLPCLGVAGEVPEPVVKLPRDEKNTYGFLNAAVVATELEKTQINMFHTKGGTGFAAEEANALRDRFLGRGVDQVGRNNELNGADRIVNGVKIQTKYFDCAANTVRAAFDSEGMYRYRGMLLEVPRDQYEECLTMMREKIRAGQVPEVMDPKEADRIVKKGDVTYQQAKNIAKACTIEGLVFDAKTQSVTSSYAFAISFSINFAKLKWEGKPTDEALTDSVSLGLQSGATSLVTGIAVSQVLRTRAAAIGTVTTRGGVKVVARTKVGRGIVEKVAQASLDKPLYGAAATNHVAKLLRTSAVASVVTTAVISTPDFYRAAFRKSVSWKQFAKNLAVNGTGVAGGTGGAIAGAAAGRAVGSLAHVPGGEKAGGIVGGLVGGVVGGVAASWGSKQLLDGLIEDDAKAMLRLLPDCLEPLATDYMLSELETDEFVQTVAKRLDLALLREMFRSHSREGFVYATFEPACEVIVRKRSVVALPEPAEVDSVLMRIANEAVA